MDSNSISPRVFSYNLIYTLCKNSFTKEFRNYCWNKYIPIVEILINRKKEDEISEEQLDYELHTQYDMFLEEVNMKKESKKDMKNY
jgi:hypothetical protein